MQPIKASGKGHDRQLTKCMEKILLEKPTVNQLVKKFPAPYGIQQLLQSLANLSFTMPE
jgi:hypothetical protein